MKKLLFLLIAVLAAACDTIEQEPAPQPTLDGTVWAKHYNDKVSPWQKVLEFRGDRLDLKMEMAGKVMSFESYEYVYENPVLWVNTPLQSPSRGVYYGDSLHLQGETYIRVTQ